MPEKTDKIITAESGSEEPKQHFAIPARSGLLRGFMFVHLKGDLEVDPIDWINCLDPYDASDDSRPASRRGPLTSYGIAKDMQELLSGFELTWTPSPRLKPMS